jgi:phosphoglycerol transferase MdoB-like AlkP superfamily enzyme
VNEPTTSRWRRTVEAFLPGLAHTALLALLCNLVLELVQVAALQGPPWQYKTPAYALMFLLGVLVLWLVVGLVHAVLGRLWLTGAFCVAATAVLAVADYEKVRLRREPLYPSDTEFAGDAGFLTRMVGPRGILLGLLAALVLGVTVWLLARWLGRRLARRGAAPASRRTRTAVRMATAAACVLGLGYLAGFNSPSNAARGAYELLGAQWRPWSQQRNYLGNGFVGGLLYNLDVPTARAPAGYDADTMRRIADRYTAAAQRINRTRHVGRLDDVNVVLVLSESFSDPTRLRGIDLERDPIPFTRRLMSSTTSGQMLAHSIGGGTANMEFEALTGMSMSQLPPRLRVPYQTVVPDHDTFPSAVRWFESHGHRAVAIHPFSTEMYRRRDVYRSFGFDDFVYDERMRDRSRIGHDAYISDAAAFDELHRQLASTAQPLLVNLVTMQNHVPYAGRYDDPVHVTGPDGEPLDGIGQYVRGLTHSDAALRDLINGLDRLDEPTVLVFYGDHLPGTYPEDVYTGNGPRVMRETPYFVWSNLPGSTAGPPLTSPAHFVDLALERAGAAVSPYYALMQELRQTVPAVDAGMMFDVAGRPTSRHRLSAHATRLLRDYRLVQYDLAFGRRYSERAVLGDVPVPVGSPHGE